jgi:hypothetical protein
MQQVEGSPFLNPNGNSAIFNSNADPSSRTGLTHAEEASRSQTSMIGLGTTPPAAKSTWLQNEVKHQKRNRALVSLSWS